MKEAIINGKKAFVELKFGPNWSYISTVRTFIVNFLAITLDDKKRADQIAMAVNELIENAIKYSDRDGIEIDLNVLNNNDINVIVCNHTSEENVKLMDDILKEIYSIPPLDAFMKRMKESADLLHKSSIGLSRIRYETNADIKYDYKDGFVTVSAHFSGKENGGTYG